VAPKINFNSRIIHPNQSITEESLSLAYVAIFIQVKTESMFLLSNDDLVKDERLGLLALAQSRRNKRIDSSEKLKQISSSECLNI
jgi:hypothetical protein